MQPIPYTSEAFHEEYPHGFITPFTHGPLAKGVTDEAYTKTCVTSLNRNASAAISFNPEMLKGTQLDGGACTALALRVGKHALKAERRLAAHMLPACAKETSFLLELSRTVCLLEQMSVSNAKESKAEQAAVRSEQMALNTITVDRTTVLVWQCGSRKGCCNGSPLRTQSQPVDA